MRCPRFLYRYSTRPGLLRILPLIVLGLFCLTDLLWARAGGGGGFSSGRSRSSGGGGDGGGVIIYLLFQLCIRYPHIGIPLTIIVIGGYIYFHIIVKDKHQGSVIRQGRAARNANRSHDAVTAMQQSTSQINQQALCTRVETAFVKLQEAWCAQNLEAVRPFISDGIWERFNLQFQEQQAEGVRDKMEEITVNRTRMALFVQDGPFDVLTVAINAQARDYRVSSTTGKRVSGSKSIEPFTEYWSFMRKQGASELGPKPGLMEGNCPNCGAGVEINQAANCQHCGALLRSGDFDWVLVEITQESEWTGDTPDQIPGMDAIKQADPSFTAQALEDRTSVVFYRKALAERTGKADKLGTVASPEYYQEFAEALNKSKKKVRLFYSNSVIGSVDTIGIEPGSDWDRAYLEIHWMGTKFSVAPGAKPKKLEAPKLFHTIYVMGRKPGAKTLVDYSVSSSHCPKCGAPAAGSATGKCEYCQARLNDGQQEWVLLDSTLSRSDPKVQALLRQLSGKEVVLSSAGGGAFTPSSAAALSWMVKVAFADGSLDKSEEKMLDSFAAKYSIPQPLLSSMIEQATQGTLAPPPPASDAEAREWLREMARMALADGKLDRAEADILIETGTILGMSKYDMKMLLKKTKTDMFKEAKAEVKKAKKHGTDLKEWQAALKKKSDA